MSRQILTCGEASLVLDPRLGGSVSSWTVAGREILRAARNGADDPRDTGGFPLVPFCGRIPDGRLNWEGGVVTLPPNMPPEPHAIHGFGWQTDWRAERQGEAGAVLTHRHEASLWPWTYEAWQRFDLSADMIKVTLRLTNLDTRPMPASFGWHPYFPAAGARLRAPVCGVWPPDPEQLTALSPQTDLREPRPVAELALDHAFKLDGRAIEMTWPGRSIGLRMAFDDIFGSLVVYTPAGEDFFCVEPISAPPNAANFLSRSKETGLSILAPGETVEGAIVLTVFKTEA